MAAESLVEQKLDASRQMVEALVESGAPLLAAFWSFDGDVDRWTLMLVPTSQAEYRQLVKHAADLLIAPQYSSIFSFSDTAVDSQQIDRARALGAYIRNKPDIGRRIDTVFTGGQFFESAIPVYFRPELMTHLQAAS